MIDSLTFQAAGGCMNLFASPAELLAFLIEAQPAELLVLLDRESGKTSQEALPRPVAGWQESDAPTIADFLSRVLDAPGGPA